MGMKKKMKAIWDDFDKEDPAEWLLLFFGYAVLILLLVGVWVK